MKDSARHVKIVEWSDEDRCYVGSSPGLIYGGCHGDDEKAVFAKLCEIVEDAIEVYHRAGRPLPPATSGRDFATKMQGDEWSGTSVTKQSGDMGDKLGR